MFLAIIIFIFIFSFLVLSHELGHFFAAKKLGVKVEELGIGLPPRAYGKKIGETMYSINWIPFGGFVRLLGEDPGSADPQEQQSFDNKKPKIKAIILLAGVTVNILTAIFLFYILLGFNSFQTNQVQLFDYRFPLGNHFIYPPAISLVKENSPAAEAGIEEFDLILSGNGKEFQTTEELIVFLQENAGQEVVLFVQNFYTKQEKIVTLTPRKDPPEGEGPAGIGINSINRLSYDTPIEKIFSGFLHGYNMVHFTFTTLGNLIKTSIIEKNVAIISRAVSGPVGILAFTKMSLEVGFWQVFTLAAVLSLALGTMNLLPIPAVDGGRMIFVLYEAIFRKRAPAKLERGINMIGFYFLLALLFLITLKDIKQFKDILF